MSRRGHRANPAPPGRRAGAAWSGLRQFTAVGPARRLGTWRGDSGCGDSLPSIAGPSGGLGTAPDRSLLGHSIPPARARSEFVRDFSPGTFGVLRMIYANALTERANPSRGGDAKPRACAMQVAELPRQSDPRPRDSPTPPVGLATSTPWPYDEGVESMRNIRVADRADWVFEPPKPTPPNQRRRLRDWLATLPMSCSFPRWCCHSSPRRPPVRGPRGDADDGLVRRSPGGPR